ncbi:MAG: hypothetical protein K0R65_282 [Crocinitomicaceae bacterium]|jgi:hypothetical protein|nr:hypothetical protein [Crocinitomicaceae bacterium]
MKQISKEYSMNGVSISWGARTLPVGIACCLVAIGLQHIAFLIVGVFIVFFAVGLTLSRSAINFDQQNKTLFFAYRNLFGGNRLEHTISENSYLTFQHSNNANNTGNFLLVSTSWYPVRESSYFVVLKSGEQDPIIVKECLNLKETVSFCKSFGQKTGIEFRSPLKSRNR